MRHADLLYYMVLHSILPSLIDLIGSLYYNTIGDILQILPSLTFSFFTRSFFLVQIVYYIVLVVLLPTSNLIFRWKSQ